jgi:hypothetical protein
LAARARSSPSIRTWISSNFSGETGWSQVGHVCSSALMLALSWVSRSAERALMVSMVIARTFVFIVIGAFLSLTMISVQLKSSLTMIYLSLTMKAQT